MTSRHTFVRYAVCAVMAVVLAGPAIAADRKTTNTLLGAGLGAAAGAVLSEGDPMLTLGGAAAGGLLGNVLTEDRRHYNRSHRHHHKAPKHRYRSKHAPYYAATHYGHKHKKYKKHTKHRKHSKHRKYSKHYR